MTKKGEPMAFLQLEDVSGQVEAIIFPSSYPQLETLLLANTPLIIWGKIDKKDEKYQLIIEDMEPIEKAQIVILDLSITDALDNHKTNNLKGIIQEQSGDKAQAKTPVIARLKAGTESKLIRFGQDFWVQNATSLQDALSNAGFTAEVSSLI
jgi:DNA polymerase-3 subunit alpha